MFKNILVPVSSEFHPKEVLERSVFLAEKFRSSITIIYIIEEKMLHQTDRLSDTVRTYYDRGKIKREIVREQMRAADSIIFEDAKLFFRKKGISFDAKIVKGEYSDVVKQELTEKNYDLIVMGFEKGSILHYRLLDEVKIPIWVEAEGEGHSILAICSNLAPNKKVPEISVGLAQILKWDLHMLYIVDIQDSVEVDEKGVRSNRKPLNDLILKGEKFVEDMRRRGIKAQLITGVLEKETIKAADAIKPNLVIVGREQKKKTILGLPVKHFKKKMAEKSRYSILFVN
ncbi:MAG: universal stress protein [Thermoplasmata archaeon]|nr:MAG: universal stress protein [Thermoplasmata archaeon]